MLRAMSCCFLSGHRIPNQPYQRFACSTTEKTLLLAERQGITYSPEKAFSYRRPKTDVAAEVVSALCSTVSTASSSDLEQMVRASGWWDEAVAQAVLAALEKALATSKAINSAIQRAVDRAVAEARKMKEFADEHPILTGVFLTIVALGVLYLVWPEMLLALGFGEEGPVLGSFAARWQSLYPDVPAGSVFAFLQRLGMNVRPAILCKP